jgi:DNA-binding MarR family transcriptional regulator
MTCTSNREAMVASEVVDLLLQLSRGLLAELDRDQLTPAQWIALRYFSRANTFSRTLSGLATYQATTAGTASQTIKSLEQSGFVERDISARDARSSVFTLTDAGRQMVEQYPLIPLAQEVKAMDPSELLDLREVLRNLVASIGGQQSRHPFGTCRGCALLVTKTLKGAFGTHSLCRVLNLPVADTELDLLCKIFQPSPPTPHLPTA